MIQLESRVADLYSTLVGTFNASAEDFARIVNQAAEQSQTIARELTGTTIQAWSDDLAGRLLTVVVLLDHVGASRESVDLLRACQNATRGDQTAQVKFAATETLIAARRGHSLNDDTPRALDDTPHDSRGRLAANLVLASRYTNADNSVEELLTYLRLPEFQQDPVVQFALASLVFDHSIFAARLDDSRAALERLGQLSSSLLRQLGDNHPYLGLVLLALASAKCGQAAAEGNIQDLRRYSDVLSIAVQRASAQLGPEHVHTLGALANLAHAEFEIALASRSPREVTASVDHLAWLEQQCRRVLGESHPTTVVLAINTAVASLESARQTRSIERIHEAAQQLRSVAALAEQSYGTFHPCTAIAYSNAASAEFDLARARRSKPQLERVARVLEDAVGQVSNSLGAHHATARALASQLRACHRLIASDDPQTDGPGGGVGTVVRTIEDEMWGLSDDYVPVYEASPGSGSGSRQVNIYVEGPGEEDILAAIDKTIKYFNDGDIVEGIVVKVDPDKVLLDIGYKTEGVIPSRELSIKHDVDPAEVVSVGDEVEALVLQKEDKEGRLILSKKRADYQRAWSVVERLHDADEPVKGTVIEVVKGGLILDIGLRGFLPASLVEMRRVRDLQPYVGRELEAKIIELDKNRNNVVLSRRAWLEQTQSEVRSEFLNQLQKGQVRKGVVSSIVNFGAYVDLGGVDGLVHVSELSWKHSDHPSEVVEVGQEVTVEVLNVDLDRQSVSLSLRATQEDPWHQFARTHAIGQTVPGKVTKLERFGAFVRVDEGIEGLVHISELAERRLELPEQVVQVGNEVMVKVIDIDLKRRRISLSLKQANPDSTPDTLERQEGLNKQGDTIAGDKRLAALREGLSPQERKILELIANGLTNRQIGAQLYLAEKTVQNYVSTLMHKLGYDPRTEPAGYATRTPQGERDPVARQGESTATGQPSTGTLISIGDNLIGNVVAGQYNVIGDDVRTDAAGGLTPRIGFVVDVVGYASRSSAQLQHDIQLRLRHVVGRAVDDIGIAFDDTDHDDGSGDGIAVFLPVDVDYTQALPGLLSGTAARLTEDNNKYRDRMRLRMAVGAGLLSAGPTGFTGGLIIDIHRLLDSAALRAAVVAHTESDLLVLVTNALQDDVIRPGYLDPAAFRFIRVDVAQKEFTTPAWLWIS